MKTLTLFLGTCVTLLSLASCSGVEKDVVASISQTSTNGVDINIAKSIETLGFSAANATKVKDGYLVENDVILTDEDLKGGALAYERNAPQEEQYRTTRLVKGLPRVITVMIAPTFAKVYIDATDEMIRRYNALGLKITFKRITSGTPSIKITADATLPSGVLGVAGFPNLTGNPYSSVRLRTATFSATPKVAFVATVLAHEVGHCIGFRHTDYMARVCGGGNEGTGTMGAALIPGTPSTIDYKSWMLSCAGSDVPFSAKDITALNTLYK